MENDQSDASHPSPEPTPSEPPQAVPDDLNTVAGVREVHPAVDPTTCHAINKMFRRMGLRLSMTIIPVDATGRIGLPRRRGKRVSSKRGRMVICLFEGPDAVEDRFGVNDDYENAGVAYPSEYPNDYRRPVDPFNPPPYSQDPHMGSPPPPDPNAEPPF
ncbi:MAG: hypothetical protein H7Z11_18295 [Verrucomicrobia bacterium]|nr:hypothetical protein [Leptolyngbya sp. ES-bin-22]